jgi:hypothetical protein
MMGASGIATENLHTMIDSPCGFHYLEKHRETELQWARAAAATSATVRRPVLKSG